MDKRTAIVTLSHGGRLDAIISSIDNESIHFESYKVTQYVMGSAREEPIHKGGYVRWSDVSSVEFYKKK